MKKLFTFFAALLFSLGANAQFVNGQVLTAPALNNALANPVITGGSINGVNIGAVTAGTGRFTALNATSIGATTPGTGVFTTLSASTPITVASGGTGVGTLTNHGVLVGAGTGNVTQLSVGTTGQMLIGVTGADPAFGNNPTITGGTIDGAVIGGVTPVAGTFTTLRGNSLVKVIADTPTAQSIATSTSTTITNWVERLDSTSSFNPVTGIFTAPRTGQYLVSAEIQYQSATYTAGQEATIIIAKNGSQARTVRFVVVANGTFTMNTGMVTAVMDLVANDTIAIQAFQNTGGSVNTASNQFNTFVTISELP